MGTDNNVRSHQSVKQTAPGLMIWLGRDLNNDNQQLWYSQSLINFDINWSRSGYSLASGNFVIFCTYNIFIYVQIRNFPVIIRLNYEQCNMMMIIWLLSDVKSSL